MNNQIFVLYDGIRNPVFAGQVLKPFIKKLDEHSDNQGTIISFERSPLSSAEQERITRDPRITLIILLKIPFFGSLSLRYAAHQLKKVLPQLSPASHITCRGPLAAWIVGHSNFPAHIPCIVQARGLAAHEYRYAHQSHRMQWVHRIRAWQYEQIERLVYGTFARQKNVMIHAVSTALATYLMEQFNTPKHRIIVADHDVPHAIPIAQRNVWRTEIRIKLNIPSSAYVYVYNGSAKPWQCPEQTVQFFIDAYHKNPLAFLLILTQDIALFYTLVARYQLPRTAYCITEVAHTEIYRYLSAADAGILLREPHIINWVSRPTKALEYEAVGLPIIHNNTIGMLQNEKTYE